MKLKISQLNISGDTQVRNDPEAVSQTAAEYTIAMQDGVTFPPLEVMYDGKDYWLWDGFIRRMAYLTCGISEVECNVTSGSKEDAQWASYSANKTHGMRRGPGDVKVAVVRSLKHPSSKGLTNGQIAEHAGCSPRYVQKVREDMKPVVRPAPPTVESSPPKGGEQVHPPTGGEAKEPVFNYPDSEPLPATKPDGDLSIDELQEPYISAKQKLGLVKAIIFPLWEGQSTGGHLIDVKERILENYKNLQAVLHSISPHSKCPVCEGKGCKGETNEDRLQNVCRGTGFITQHQANLMGIKKDDDL